MKLHREGRERKGTTYAKISSDAVIAFATLTRNAPSTSAWASLAVLRGLQPLAAAILP
jgi:hypothetical protein